MKIEGTDGIEIIGKDGDRAVLNDDLLAFYKDGFPDIPHWYSKRVAHGVAQDGDSIDLGWDKDPKVLTAIKQLQTYTAKSNADDQIYTSYADAISKDGFYVYGRSIILDSASKLTHDVAHNLGIVGSWTSVDSQSLTTDLELTISATTEITHDHPSGSIKELDIDYSIYYKTASSSSWILYKSDNIYKYVNDYNYDNKTFSKTYNIASLSPDSYNIKVEIDVYRYGQDFTLNQWIEWANTVVDNGEVMWIAVEGGAQ